MAIQEEQAEASQESQERDALYILMNFAKEYYRGNLVKTEEGRSVGLTYFRERGFNDRTLEKFELGYALEGWEHFSTEAIQKGYNRELLEKAGLVVKKEDGSAYDRFRGRVIFPVHSISGKVIAFGARMLGKDKTQPKYINSPETEIYHKSNVLYGLYQAKNSIRQHDNCYLVEGYTDVISLHQSDVDNVVASSGTALTVDQVKLIRRFTENITVLYDGDTAGIKAAIRGIDIVLKEGLNVYVLLFPDGEDPDSYSRKVGSTAFSEFLTRKKGFISFIIDSFPDQVKNDPIKKSEALISILESLALIPDEKKRAPYYDEIARKLNVPINVVISETNKIRLKAEYSVRNRETQVILPEVIAKSEEPIIKVDPAGMVYYQERETIRLLLNYADQALEDNKVASFLVQELEDVEFTNEVFRDIYGRFKEGVERGDRVDSQYFLQQGSAEIKKAVTDLLTSRYEVRPHWRD
ncbi:MAG TPA: DNA primase, partial [Cytophagales bacterium]|nr:DNA primase [Cytophagales bacterium]